MQPHPPPPPRPMRIIRAGELLSGQVVLDRYPFRYVILAPEVSVGKALGNAFNPGAAQNQMLDEVLTAVELLESRGWELVSLDQGFVACLRRVR